MEKNYTAQQIAEYFTRWVGLNDVWLWFEEVTKYFAVKRKPKLAKQR